MLDVMEISDISDNHSIQSPLVHEIESGIATRILLFQLFVFRSGARWPNAL